jgi:molybdenum cofactor cytidylyltransferase
MKFGPLPVEEAAGAFLAHSIALDSGSFKKGRRISAADLERLRGAGVAEVIAAQLEDGDVHEDEAASRIAGASAGDGVHAAAAFTGRANLISDIDGIAVVDNARVCAINSLDESVTVATSKPYAVVRRRQMVATVKIIPLSAPAPAVADAERIAGEGGPLVRIAPFRDRPVGLIQTQSEGTRDKVLDKTTRTMRDRIEACGSHLVREIRCAHREDEVTAAVTELLEMGCAPVLVIGASAIVDRRDVIPAAIERAGGTVDRFGMPVDPGNLLLLAHRDEVPIIGTPGCARSPKFNGFDHVLARVLADVPVIPEDIIDMGAGGLLTELPSRPQPRDAEVDVPSAPHIAAIVLAGGQSRRTGTVNKLLATLDGTAMVARVVDTVVGSGAEPVWVVTGHEAEALEAALAGRNVRFTHNPRFAEGLSTSLKQGLKAVLESDEQIDGALVCLGDMPSVRAVQIGKLMAAFNPKEGRSICLPIHEGRRGNPVLWGRQYFIGLADVAGDMGARYMISSFEEEVCEVTMDDDAIFLDVDTPEALAAIGATPAEAKEVG